MEETRPHSSVHSAISDALGTADLRRLQLAWLVSATAAWVFFVALAVYAYDAAGAAGVGAATLVRMIPAGLAAPLAGTLADRTSRRDVLLVSLVFRAWALLGITFAVWADAPTAVVLALAAVFTICATAHKPAQAALLPSLADTPRQLAASNAVWSGVDNGAFLGGALLGGVLIALASVPAAFAVTAALFVFAALPMGRIPRDTVPPYREDVGTSMRGVVDSTAQGFREVLGEKRLRLVVGFLGVSTLVEGAVDVLVVVVAIELLDLGGAGVGWLNSCWGLGGLLGGLAALVLLRRGTLASGLALGGLLIGLPLIGIAAFASVGATALLLVFLGIGYSLVEVAGLSLLQRLNSEDVLARAFSVVESQYWVTTGLGAILAPVLVDAVGTRDALIAVGTCLPVVVVLRWAALRRLEAGAPVPEAEFRALRALPDFAPLPLAVVENVSRRMSEMRVTAGQVVIREGDPGEFFYVVAAGSFEVACHGGPALDPLGRGDYFGEIALLRDIPRTATVTAQCDSLLYALDRDAFLSTISAHPCTTEYVAGSAQRRFDRAHADVARV
jgi:predicted MFS family arabinose efflux permease